MIIKILLLATLPLVMTPVYAQTSQSTHITGKTEINVQTEDTVAVAKGSNNEAVNRIGVIKGDKKGNTKISVQADHVTTIVSGHGKKASTNIGGIISDDKK